MTEWYSWQDLLYRWNKRDFELLELIKKGLQPFSEYDNPISFQSIFPKSGDKDVADEKAPSWEAIELPFSDKDTATVIKCLKKAQFRRANVIDVELQTDLWKHTRPTLRWLTGNDVLELWGIDEFDLCKLIFEWGLQAYDSRTLRSIKTGSELNNSIGDGETDRKDFGSLISGTQEQKIEAMERLRFKPFEVEEFEEQNRNFFEKPIQQPSQHKENSQVVQPAAVRRKKSDRKEFMAKEASCDISQSNESILVEKDLCTIKYRGQEEVFKSKVGFRHIAFLIEHSPKEIACRNIYDENYAALENDNHVNYQPSLSKSERDGLKQRANEVWKKLDSFQSKSDSSEKDKAGEEWQLMRNYLYDHGMKAIPTKKGLSFKEFRKAVEEDEKARTNVSNNIKNAINEIEKKLPQLAKHLEQKLKKGYKCAYLRPQDEQIAWEIK